MDGRMTDAALGISSLELCSGDLISGKFKLLSELYKCVLHLD